MKVEASTRSAVDQPFSYAQETLKLLLNYCCSRGDADVSAYCFRKTDNAMRTRLTELHLDPNYVMSPNRMQNIWRALALAKLAAGCPLKKIRLCEGKLIETHPRVSWAILLADHPNLKKLIKGYKGKENVALTRSRKIMLNYFERSTLICPEGSNQNEQDCTRKKAQDSDDQMDALLCAYVAFLHNNKSTVLCGYPMPIDKKSTSILKLEGAVVLPEKTWTWPLPHCVDFY